MLKTNLYIAVFIGGCLGAMGRFSVSMWLESASFFPFETLIVNLIGCFLLTYIGTHPFITNHLSKTIQVGMGTGIIGSFTTFSTFSTETIQLWQDTSIGWAFTYIITSMVGGLLLSWLGIVTGKKRREEI